MSIYDNIKTAKDLITEVRAHGLSTNQEDICRAQDIFGHSTVGELAALATDNGRRNSDGTPNQFGSMSSGSDGTQKIFYQIIFTIWSWEQATEYYNKHSNLPYIEGRNAVEAQKRMAETLENQNAHINRLKEELTEYNDYIKQLENEKVEYQSEIDAKDAEIFKLKARLFDLMVASEK